MCFYYLVKNLKQKNPMKKIIKRKNQKKKGKNSSFPVVLDKMCVFCLYHIPDYQQYIKRGSCWRPILSGLFCSFKYRNMLIVVFALIIFVPYLSLNVMLCMFPIVSCFSYFIYVKCHFILFLQLIVFLINLIYLFIYVLWLIVLVKLIVLVAFRNYLLFVFLMSYVLIKFYVILCLV